MKRNSLGVASSRQGSRSIYPLGPLEARVMRAVWEDNPCTVRDIFEALNKGKRANKRLAYTTCMTVCNNLVKKGYLVQHKDGVAYLYEARRDQRAVVEEAVNALCALADWSFVKETMEAMESPF